MSSKQVAEFRVHPKYQYSIVYIVSASIKVVQSIKTDQMLKLTILRPMEIIVIFSVAINLRQLTNALCYHD